MYPHTLESHVLSTLPVQLEQLEQTRAQRLAILESYAASKERARKAKLQAIAPGWNEGSGGVMQPVRKATAAISTTTTTERDGEHAQALLQASPTEMGPQTLEKAHRDQMQDWLDKWDGQASSSSSSADSKPTAAESGVDDLI